MKSRHRTNVGYLRYRDFGSEKPPAGPLGETREDRIARVLRDMPAAIFDNPELRILALKKAAPTTTWPDRAPTLGSAGEPDMARTCA